MAKIDDFKARFPNFDTVTVDTYFPIVEDLAGCYYGGTYESNKCEQEILLNLYAHLIHNENASAVEPIRNQASKSVGSVSVSFESSQDVGSQGWFNTTKYGQRYLYLISKRMGAVFV